jgi:hypothetical protein
MLVVEVIDAEHVRVIHYTGSVDKPNDSKPDSYAGAIGAVSAAVSSRHYGSAAIVEGEVYLNLKIECVVLLRYPPGVAIYKGREAIKRARSRLHEREYCLFSNNCEHFINWAIIDKKESDQIATAGGVAAGVAVVGVAVAAASLLAYFVSGDGEKRKKKDEEDYDTQ